MDMDMNNDMDMDMDNDMEMDMFMAMYADMEPDTDTGISFTKYPLKDLMEIVTKIDEELYKTDEYYHTLSANCYSRIEVLEDYITERDETLFDDYDESFVTLTNFEACTAILKAMQYYGSENPQSTPDLYSNNEDYKALLENHNNTLLDMKAVLPKKIFELIRSNEIRYRTYSVSTFFNETLQLLKDAEDILL